jgi:hypothetical protein
MRDDFSGDCLFTFSSKLIKKYHLDFLHFSHTSRLLGRFQQQKLFRALLRSIELENVN